MTPERLERIEWLERPPVRAVLAALNRNGAETRAVGGAVRNALMGLPVDEVDMATTATPDQVIALAEAAGLKAIPTGKAHGTITVVADGHGFEVTTLRRDVETDGRHAKVAFTDDWAADASRRDFTMNALYADGEGCLFDPLCGYADVEAGRVRFIGEPERRIEEDYLRILRFFRFQATYGKGPIDPAGVAACVRLRAGLAGLSAERIWAEFKRLLVASGTGAVAETLYDHGLLADILGGVPRLPQFEALIAIEQSVGVEPEAALRLAALGVFVMEDVERLAARFRLSNAEQAVLSLAASAAARDLPRPAEAKELLYRLGESNYRKVVLLGWARSERAPGDEAARVLYDLPAHWTVPAFPLRGEDIAALGTSGPEIGRTLRALERAWIESDFARDREALLEEARLRAKHR